MKKKEILLPVLAVFIGALVLFSMSLGLSDAKIRSSAGEMTDKLMTLLPGSDHFTEEIYTGEDATIDTVWTGETGYVIETVTPGYVGDITMLIGVSKDGHVTGLQIRDMEETPGLGWEALTDVAFLVQFLNTTGEAQIGQTVDAITGATVTSKAIARSVNAAVGYVTGADTSSGATSWGG